MPSSYRPSCASEMLDSEWTSARCRRAADDRSAGASSWTASAPRPRSSDDPARTSRACREDEGIPGEYKRPAERCLALDAGQTVDETNAARREARFQAGGAVAVAARPRLG